MEGLTTQAGHGGGLQAGEGRLDLSSGEILLAVWSGEGWRCRGPRPGAARGPVLAEMGGSGGLAQRPSGQSRGGRREHIWATEQLGLRHREGRFQQLWGV